MGEVIDPRAWYVTRDRRVIGSAHLTEEAALDSMDAGDDSLMPVQGMTLLSNDGYCAPGDGMPIDGTDPAGGMTSTDMSIESVGSRARSLARAALDEPAWVPYGDMQMAVISGKIAAVIPGRGGLPLWIVDTGSGQPLGEYASSVQEAKRQAALAAGYQPIILDIVADVLRSNPGIDARTAVRLAAAARTT